MKIPRIISSLDYISDKKIAEAAPVEQTAKKRISKTLFYSIGGTCAAAAVIGAAVLGGGLSHGSRGVVLSGTSSPNEMVTSEPISDYISPASSNDGNSAQTSSTPEPLPNLYTPYEGGEFSIDYDNLPFKYIKGTSVQKFNAEPLIGGDFEGARAYDVSELIENNPWDESLEITELPVFLRKYGSEQVLVLGDEAFPEGCSLTDHGNGTSRVNAYLYLAEKYSDKLIFNDFMLDVFHDYNYEGAPVYGVKLRKNSDNPFEAILYYNFTSIEFYQDVKKGIVLRQSNLLDTFTAVGFYPTITVDSAREKLLSGDYFSTVLPEYLPNSVTEDRIKHTELVYRNTKNGYCIPYYRFLVELDRPKTVTMAEGLITYGAYYVPAISPEYLSTDDDLSSSPSAVEEWLKQPHASPLENLGVLVDRTGDYRFIPADCGTKVMAIDDGEVISVGYEKNNIRGYTVVIKHSDGIYTLYHHLDKDLGFEVSVGDTVKAGQCIGYVGNSGNIEGYGLGFQCTDEEPNFD